jgi:hypothetical protein
VRCEKHGSALLRELDPVTGKANRASRGSANRYEHDHAESLIHIDVKKLGRIPDGGGWRAQREGSGSRETASTTSTPP